MRIIIHAGFLSKQYTTGLELYLHELIMEMAKRHSTHTFIYLAFKPMHLMHLPGNVSIHYAAYPRVKWWQALRLPHTLKKLQAGLVIATEDFSVNSGKVPLCMFVLNRLDAAAKKKLPVYKKLQQHFLHRAGLVVGFSEHHRQSLLHDDGFMPQKITLLHVPLPGSMKPLPYAEKERIKLQFAAGLEYFLFAGDIDESHGLVELLKAFSQFKKWQQSNMQLVIAGNRTRWTEQLLQKTATFTYRNDVRILSDLPQHDLHALIGAAYALVYPAPAGHFPLNILLAMQAEVPVIASPTAIIKELVGNAVLYAGQSIAEGFGEHMRRLFKDEVLRASVIASAKEHLAQKGATDAADDCWAAMMRLLPP